MSLVYHPISMSNAWAPLVVVPLHAMLHVLCPRRWWFVADIISLVATPVIVFAGFLLVLLFLFDIPDAVDAALAVGIRVWIVGGAIFAWMLFLAACRYRTRCGSLTSQ